MWSPLYAVSFPIFLFPVNIDECLHNRLKLLNAILEKSFKEPGEGIVKFTRFP